MSHKKKWIGALVALSVSSCPLLAQTGLDQQKLVASDAQANDAYGFSIAIDGDTMVVGANLETNGTGAAYVYVRQNDGSWQETQILTASDAAPGAEFGYSIGISGDWIAVGARLEDQTDTDMGAVYMYQRQGDGSWLETQKVQHSDAARFDHLGTHLQLTGNQLLVGAPRDDDNGRNSGSAYLFEESGGTWSQTAKLKPSDGQRGELFPAGLDVDGDRIILSTIVDNNLRGAAYIFDRVGGVWSETQKITHSDPTNDDQFGFAVAVKGDTALVSARLENANGDNAGSIYAFEFNGNAWVETQKFQGSDTAPHDQFGFVMEQDGDRLIVGAQRANPDGRNNGGKAYVFQQRPSDNQWVEEARIFPSDPNVEDFFGWAVDISGTRCAIGASNDDEGASNAGAAYFADSSLLRDGEEIDLSVGGSVNFHINLGFDHAGEQYWVVGSSTGIFPGVTLTGLDIPLNFDTYFLLMLTAPNIFPFANSRGVLDSAGSATFTLSFPSFSTMPFSVDLHHSVLTYSSAGPVQFLSASEPCYITVTD